MRELEVIPHPTMRISILQFNSRFQVRFEAGPMEQIYKFDAALYKDLNAVKLALNETFINHVRSVFNTMYTLYS
jgi:hypothetical protein